MSRRFFLSTLLLLFGATPPATAAKVRSGFDSNFDFAAAHTYRWKVEKGPSSNEDLDHRVRATADEVLAKKGMKKVGPGEPADLLLLYSVGTEDMLVAGRTAEIGWYGDIWVIGAARSRMSGGILMEFQEPESEKAVWGASWVQSGNNPDTLMLLFKDADKAVEKAMGKYPPKKK